MNSLLFFPSIEKLEKKRELLQQLPAEEIPFEEQHTILEELRQFAESLLEGGMYLPKEEQASFEREQLALAEEFAEKLLKNPSAARMSGDFIRAFHRALRRTGL